MKRKKRYTLQNKIRYYFSSIFFTILIFVGVIIVGYSNMKFKNQSYEYCDEIVETTLQLLDNYFLRLQNVSKLITNDKNVLKAISYRNTTNKIDYSIELYNQWEVEEELKKLDIMTNITNAVIIDKKMKSLYYYKISVDNKYKFDEQSWFYNSKEIDALEGSNFYFTNLHPTDYRMNDFGGMTVSMITPILGERGYGTNKVAYLMCDFDIASVFLNNSKNNEIGVMIYDRKEPIYFSENLKLSKNQIKEIEDRTISGEEKFIIKGKGREEDFLVSMNTANISGWNIVGVKSLNEIHKMKWTLIVFLAGLIIVSGIIILITSTLISKTILIPMNRLIHKFNRIGDGDYSIKFEDEASQEVNKLAQTAENMIYNMVELSNKVLEEQRKLSIEQMKVLQHQINPHFLNNVLQSIKALALNQESEKISEIVTLLGKMLTYSIYQPYVKVDIITEIQYVENYIRIQNIRFDKNISYSIQCEDQLKNIKIPKLIIQPLIENSIEHGLINKYSGIINIIVTKEEEDLCIIVTDNGEGISQKITDNLNMEFKHKDSYTSGKSIGLLNVNQRIKSEYGDDYGLKVVSKEDIGTNIIITFPYLK